MPNQAAAHGVPTVATKNGGPVDIMATLHHGLLVDPTNSKQIAKALLEILTNPHKWDEMSRNGAPPASLTLLLTQVSGGLCASKLSGGDARPVQPAPLSGRDATPLNAAAQSWQRPALLAPGVRPHAGSTASAGASSCCSFCATFGDGKGRAASMGAALLVMSPTPASPVHPAQA